MEELKDRISKIIQGWYIYENALFEISILHRVEENAKINCLARSGAGKIEYNPEKLKDATDEQLESVLMVECIRLLLKHPYERQPDDCGPKARLLASNLIIGDNYQLPGIEVPKPEDFKLAKGKSYEWYAYHLQGQADKAGKSGNGSKNENGKNGGNNGDGKNGNNKDNGSPNDLSSEEAAADATALWQEDSLMEDYLDNLVEKISHSNNWGTLPKSLVQSIIDNARAKIDYRKVLAGFRASVLCSKRCLTRMRPNRRTGFDNMGSKRDFATRLLVAVDVSGSISIESLNLFLSVVNKAFKYGIEELDVITFDTVIHDIIPFKKAKREIKIHGRGGTDFQPAIDYAQAHRYDGLLVLTDGIAPLPKMPPHPHFKIAWVFDSMESYTSFSSPLSSLGRCCPIQY